MFNHTDEQIRKGNESKIQILEKNQEELHNEFGAKVNDSDNDLQFVLRPKLNVGLNSIKEDTKLCSIIISSRQKVNF